MHFFYTGLSTINSLKGATKSLTRLSEATAISTPNSIYASHTTPILSANSTLSTINYDLDCYKLYNAKTVDRLTNYRQSNSNLLQHAQMFKAPSKDI